jgi:ubiquinone/menaquinone biosynthesis C-methylase UbiE
MPASIRSPQELKTQIRHFWDTKPCGLKNSTAQPGTHAFYDEIEAHRYREEFHIPHIAEFEQHSGERILEIGGGIGTDGRQFAKNTGYYFDVDLSFNSLSLARRGFQLYALSGTFVNGDAEHLPFASNTFDLVYSHGVLHHTAETGQAIDEIRRVLRPGGKAIIMLYARESLSYIASHVLGRLRLEIVRARMGNPAFNKFVGLPAEHHGWLPEWIVINNSTDGVGNPLSKLYTAHEIHQLFRRFYEVLLVKYYFPRRKIPVIGPLLPRSVLLWLGNIMGSFWYIKGIK